MAAIVIRLHTVSNGEVQTIETDPPKVVATGGDTVEWFSDEGDITVGFGDHPFEKPPIDVTANKGTHTYALKIRGDVQAGKHFDCTVTIAGKTASVYGIDIRP